MSTIIAQRITDPSPHIIDVCVELFAELMSANKAIISLCGGDARLVGPLARAMLCAGALAGELYIATDIGDEQPIGYTMWMPPGQELFSTPEQRALGLEAFMAALPEDGKEYYRTTYTAEFPAFVSSCIGSRGMLDGWWLHMAMVRKDRQRQGILRALLAPVREKALQNGETLACSTTTQTNALVYQALGFALKGERTMPSPWGEWPLFVFALDAHAT
ncbi:hypothetical protein WOLCODRAFT_140107 [Wolfiporia cocos MD-104 SS10]|uniref:N-acetyltransferase domain-containing protein n=1 Tax=Wolfiporia cocos (strain MD-104) TaxID=742152 RepID=A0A2H3J0R9_WOLCO|nr:hypothetical protein WOLCODRAFT_140107 [Wolfiporia cocos MD-104 SS10]